MIIAVIYLLGAIHGCLLAAVLAQKKVNRLPNKLLALFVLICSIDLGIAAFLSFNLQVQYPHLIGVDYPITLLYGPLLYLYVKTLRNGDSKMAIIDYLHFLPFVVLLIYLIPFYAAPAIDKLALINNSSGAKPVYGFTFINHLKILHALAYVGGVIYMLVSYRRRLKDSFSSIEKINLNWLQHLITGVFIVAAIAAGVHLYSFLHLTMLSGLSEGHYDEFTLLSVTLFVYGIGYMGLHQPQVFTYSVKNDLSEIIAAETGIPYPRNGHKNKYQKSGLNKNDAERYTEELIRVMNDEKLYKNSELKLVDLAEKLEISSHNLTEVINRYQKQNFYDFVNNYRVQEVKERLNDPESKNITLLAIGLDAGFNSKSTFNAVFKKQTGMTPSQFRRQEKT